MSNEVNLDKFRAKLAERRARLAAEAAQEQAMLDSFADCVPEMEPPPGRAKGRAARKAATADRALADLAAWTEVLDFDRARVGAPRT